ncbi:hypothetical protein OAG24_01285, partial [bacterium]|nr:hypothetical protein [bacterium]
NSKRTFVIVVSKIIPKAGSPSISYKDLRRKAKNNDIVLATYGSYKGVKPDQAAKKALSAIVRAAGTDKQCAYVFTIKETTSTRNKNIPNEFSFVGMSRPLPGGPKTIKKKTTEYQVKHETVVKPYSSDVKYNYKEWPTKKRVTKSK